MFAMETRYGFFEVRIEFLNIIWTNFVLQRVKRRDKGAEENIWT
jgi:hypothetical protein